MKVVLYWVIICVVFLVLVFGLSFAVQGGDWFIYKVFAPKYEQTRRETFEEYKAYRQGMIQELESFQVKYAQTDEAGKAAIKSVVLHRVADFPWDALPKSLQDWITELKSQTNY